MMSLCLHNRQVMGTFFLVNAADKFDRKLYAHGLNLKPLPDNLQGHTALQKHIHALKILPLQGIG